MAERPYTSQSVSANISSFAGGLNTTTNPINLQENEVREIQNMDYSKFGSAVKRNGYTALNTSAFNSGATWNSLHYLELSTDIDYLMGTCGNKLAKMDALDGTWDDITGALTITAGTNNRMDWITFKDVAYGTNGVDLPIKWSGTGNGALWTTVTGLTKAKYVAKFENYIFLANTETATDFHTTRVYWSCINEPEIWNAADFNEIGYRDGQEITGLQVLGDRLVIFKERSIHVAFFTGSSDIPFTFEETPSEVGCSSGASIQKVNNNLIFNTQDGIYYFDGNNANKLSNKINATITAFKNTQFPNVVSAYQPTQNRYWASYQTAAAANPDRIITFDSYNNAFSLYKGIAANAFVVFIYNGEERIYFGDFSGYVYRADYSTNDSPINVSTAIDAYVRTKWFTFGDLVNKKGIPCIAAYFQCSNSTISFSYSYDLTDADEYTYAFSSDCGGGLWDVSKYDEGVWGRTGGRQQRLDLTGRGRVISFKFQNATLSESIQIHGVGSYVNLETFV